MRSDEFRAEFVDILENLEQTANSSRVPLMARIGQIKNSDVRFSFFDCVQSQ